MEWGDFLGNLDDYDRQPYTELETALRRMGDDRGANDVYYERRLRESRARKRWRHRGEWPRFCLELVHRGIAGFGVRPLRFLGAVAVVLLVGMWLLGRPGAVVYQDRIDQLAMKDQYVDLGWFHAFLVSLDQLLPSPVYLPGAHRWEPSTNVFWQVRQIQVTWADLAIIPNLVGWLLVPVGITLLASALRRQP